MLLIHWFFIIIFRLHVGQGVLSVPSAAVADYHHGPLCVSIWNEQQANISLERNYLGPLLPILFRNIVLLLQLRSLLCLYCKISEDFV
jgi:hypothetical protein